MSHKCRPLSDSRHKFCLSHSPTMTTKYPLFCSRRT
jgi:hypothetical protein